MVMTWRAGHREGEPLLRIPIQIVAPKPRRLGLQEMHRSPRGSLPKAATLCAPAATGVVAAIRVLSRDSTTGGFYSDQTPDHPLVSDAE
jgi:hypothetical protein